MRGAVAELDGDVVLLTIQVGGHTWPGAASVQAERLGPTTTSIDATKIILAFFDQHRKVR